MKILSGFAVRRFPPIHSPESVQAGNYRLHVPPSNFTCIESRSAHVPDARDFNLEAVLEERGEINSKPFNNHVAAS
jgi:hypothetical protein